MKHTHTSLRQKLIFAILLFFTTSITAQRPMEKLDRSVVAQQVSGGIYVNWRITSDEWYNTTYRLYRDGAKIFETNTNGASNYIDATGSTASKYTVSKVKNGVESAQSVAATVLTKGYIEVPMRDIKSLGKTGYYLNDATAADLDGDGQMELIIKRVNNDWSTTNTNYTYFEAYKLDGTFMWAIDVGPNITADVEIDIAAFDFDGDGKAEVFMRTSDNTIFGLDKNNQNGISVGDRDGDGVTNYRYSIDQSQGMGFMNAGPEYISLIDGMTGKELDWKIFIPRGKSSDWGDSYGHRANKFYFGAPYLDGKHPSLFTGRGIYTQTKMQTYDVVNKKLVPRWYWEVLSADQLFQGKYDDSPKKYYSQGYHNFTVADVDGDGCDEINWGSMTIDNDGKPLYSTELGHGDAQHYGDFDPYRKGIEVFACNEEKPGTNLRDGKTGQILYRHVTSNDCGRACAGNISDSFKGAECWGGNVGISATDKTDLTHFGVAENYAVYWDGDLFQELCDHTGFSTSKGVGYGQITKFNGYGNITPLLTTDAYSCNWSKGTPCLQADLIGDWREEEVWWRSDSLALRIYTTPIPTTNRVYSLMNDPQYRQAICWQMCGYNQPPHTSFYLGSDFPTPIPAKSTNGKLVWKGTSNTWDTSTTNFMDGDDAAGLIAENSSPISFADGKSVLFDIHSTTTNVNIPANLSPEVLTVSGTVDYTMGGSGSLTGTMHLDKMGDGSLTLSGTHSYAGTTEIWEGNMWMNGSLNNSPVLIRRHANYGGKGTSGKGISTEYNAGIYVGGQAIADTMTVNGTVKLAEGAKLYFDLSDNPTVPTIEATRSNKKNDLLIINGKLQVVSGSIISINQTVDSLSKGSYLLAKVDTLSGDISKVKIEGTIGEASELNYNSTSKELSLVIKGMRSETSVNWTGKNDGNWNLAKTANWSNKGSDDIFVPNDSVYFSSEATNHTITLVDNLPVSYMEVNSDQDYTIDGTGLLSGNMNLHKMNAAKLTINNRNNFTGKTIVDSGTLVMKYAPSATNNGGIGINNTDPSYFELKDSAVVQVTTANEITSRGLTLTGTAGGVIDVPATLYWNGNIIGTKLTKSNSGTLYIGNNNASLNETILKSGTIKLNSDVSVPYGIGKKITLLGGTLETLNGTGLYLTSNNAFDVPTGCSATVIAGARCEYNGILTGSGTLNWSCDFIRAYINGDWSAFNGNLNINANKANSSFENHFIVNNINGFPDASISIGTGVKMCYKNGTSDNGTQTIKVGMLSGAGTFYNAGLEVGTTNKDGLFSGIISGSTSVNKLGAGLWTISGANTYTGTTTVSAGTMNLNGSIGSGTITISDGALMNLNGSAAGSVIVSNGGVLNLTGTVSSSLNNSGTLQGTGTISGTSTLANSSITIPGNTSIGTLAFGSDVTMDKSATLSMQIVGSGSTSCDNLSIGGILNCNGILNVDLSSGILTNGASYQLFNVKGSITGVFSSVKLPTLDQGLGWDISELYTTGTIKIVTSTGIKNQIIKTGVKQNPTTGIFQIYTDYSASSLHILVSNLQGKMVYESNVNKNGEMFEVDLTNQPEGIYLLKIISDKENSNVVKLIKL
jgi:autotransporter-associated beta strand repeat